MSDSIETRIWRKKKIEEAKDAYPYEPQDGWKQRANCKGLGHERFFLERGVSSESATDVCKACEVQLDCLYAGLGEKVGIWGGIAERGRREVKEYIVKQGGTYDIPPNVLDEIPLGSRRYDRSE